MSIDWAKCRSANLYAENELTQHFYYIAY